MILTKRQVAIFTLLLFMVSIVLNPVGYLLKPQLTELNRQHDGNYSIEIYASQWSYQVVDPILKEEFLTQGLEEHSAQERSILTQGSSLNLRLQKGSRLEITLYGPMSLKWKKIRTLIENTT